MDIMVREGQRWSEIVRADMRKVKILPQTDFWGSEFPQNSVIRDPLKLKT